VDVDLNLIRQRHSQAMRDLNEAAAAETISKGQLAALAVSVAQAKADEEDALQAFQASEAEENEASGAADEGYRLLNAVEIMRDSIADYEVCLARISDEAEKARVRTARLKSLRAVGREAIRSLSIRFEDVLQELFPGDVTGAVSLDGPYLQLKVGPGERSTAAIDSWKAVAFDLSALTLACEGAAQLPPWLLHDSPREADLGESIYERLFTFASKLEEIASFQYIVTTTTPPPASMRRGPYLRAILKGGPAADRLLGCTL
jgi:hypothetical protein